MENKAIKIVVGDIFNCDADAILNQVDCDGKVRNSISSQIFKKYPVVRNWYKARCDEDAKMKNISGSKSALLGFPQVCYKEDYLISDVKDPQVIINLFTYENGCFSPKALSSCLQWVNKHYFGKKIAIPYLKKHENSKSWFDLFEVITKELTDCDVTLYAMEQKMKVFVVINESVYQTENSISVKVFSNYKSAKKYFDDTVKESYCTDHITISIEEQEVIE